MDPSFLLGVGYLDHAEAPSPAPGDSEDVHISRAALLCFTRGKPGLLRLPGRPGAGGLWPGHVTCTEALLRARGGAPAGEQAALPDCCLCGLPHGESSLSRLMRALLAARVSLELCLFAFSSPQLGRAVRLLHQRGVRVRVVTDCDYMALNGSQIGLLRKAGCRRPLDGLW
ncbi:mitochondrial cardiolipin hydrolase isoform X2 [Sapajus apella]|uniref:Mitochondrial cardiolipin hydrolase isoform X2 n=1 Tax=Sapajus apella TaxID=9515 RepID=A0A6J3HHQ1_SAPAP|nr:mitochondrial cardiolipin hydrolase isoform X2 [Sapajus apella]